MKRSILSHAASAATCVAAAAIALADAERTCPGGIGLLERWPTIPVGGLQFDLARGIGSLTAPDTRPAPGLPNNAAVAFQCGISSTLGLPIEQSFANAATTWNTATMPGSTAPATSFAIAPAMTRIGTYPDWLTWSSNPFGTSLILGGTPNRNQITFWEHPNVMALFGGALAVALVDLVPGTGNIRDADIAFNAHSTGVGGRPLYRFIELNQALNVNVATMGLGEPPVTTVDPIEAYVDILGVLVHELGHGGGLAHSLVDGPTSVNSSTTPTMFAQPLLTLFNAPFVLPLSGCTNHTTVQATGANTAVRGMLGEPARSLEVDDIASISVAYPGPGQAQLGSITGRVVNGAGAGVRGAHVVAIHTTSPEATRLGTFSDGAGNYVLGSLPPGSYFVFCEAPDVNGYFAGTQVPEWVDPTAGCGTVPTFEPEFLDLSDSANEFSTQSAATFVVNAGSATAVPNVVTSPVAGLGMNVAACRQVGANTVCGPTSMRGALHNDLAAVSPSIRFNLFGGTPNGLGVIGIGVDRNYGSLFGQLLEVNIAPGASVTLFMDANGSATLSLPFSASLVGSTFFAQGVDLDPATNVIRFTNAVTFRYDPF